MLTVLTRDRLTYVTNVEAVFLLVSIKVTCPYTDFSTKIVVVADADIGTKLTI